MTGCHPAIHRLTINQNVAGLWLLYGYGSGANWKWLKTGTFLVPHDSSTGCDDLLTSGVDNAPEAGL
jgi:hypothetical protein